jgi:hypothetical protein
MLFPPSAIKEYQKMALIKMAHLAEDSKGNHQAEKVSPKFAWDVLGKIIWAVF